MNRADQLQTIALLTDAAAVLVEVDRILPCAGDIVTGWRYPLVDELLGTAAMIQESLPTASEEYVTPTALAVKAGWDEPERFEWPAKVVHRFTTKTEKNVVQFLLKDRRDGGFFLKTWDERYLEAVKLEAP